MSFAFSQNKIRWVKCVICRREFPRHRTNLLFIDNNNEVRVCLKCEME